MSASEKMLALACALLLATVAYLFGARRDEPEVKPVTPGGQCFCDSQEMKNVQLRLSSVEAKLNMLSRQPVSPFPNNGSPVGEKK